SAYLYLSMSAYFETINLSGFSNWMQVQFEEEQFHAMKMFGYLNDRGGKVVLQAIDTPPCKWDSPLAVLEETLAHEVKVTGLVNDLMILAREERDIATENFIRWFIDEQVEEEDNANKLVGQLKMIKDSPQALFMIDRELGQRVYTPPTAAEGNA
ncbi:MAG: ferritin, partial [Anaerohalosphaera sp.]|nr:ferritin [Anaerohalosphaera sp.]